ncbi:hypothetical protein [Streptomyces sp. CBMA123]|uniref:hypothetical protein n=1 Tax=Streptomyces sp. CBMA123 TaxID=1896313 RepID=UPI0016621413|nr:hypothetical protein [Streptomyces sp. CBMA123]MBD0691583.1 hypothetical protein [Streptomyces sp. CBMA123]
MLSALPGGDDGELPERAFARDPTGLGPVLVTDPASGAGLLAFRTGWGGGCYPAWAGHGASVRPVGPVTEFLVIPGPGRRRDGDG